MSSNRHSRAGEVRGHGFVLIILEYAQEVATRAVTVQVLERLVNEVVHDMASTAVEQVVAEAQQAYEQV